MLKLKMLSPFHTYCKNGDTFIKVTIVMLATRLVICLHIKVFIMCVCVCVCDFNQNQNVLANFSKNPLHKFVLPSAWLGLSCSMWTCLWTHGWTAMMELIQSCTNLGHQVVMVTRFCTVLPNIFDPHSETCFISPVWLLEF